MKSVLSVTVCLLAVVAMGAQVQKKDDFDVVGEARYWLEGISGFWTGFEGGLYHDSKRSEGCLSTETKEELINMIVVLQNGFDPSQLFTYFNKIMNIFNSVQACRFDTTAIQIVEFCDINPLNCQPSAIMDNVTKNMFVLMGKVTEISAIFSEFPAADPKEFNEQTKKIGDAIGSIIRSLINFH